MCADCALRFVKPRARCPACAALLVLDEGLCGGCRTQTTAPALHDCVAAVDYAYPWDGLIARLKFRGEAGWAGPMAELMLQAPEALPLLHRCDLMVPIPLSASRLASRGYNQSWELVKALRRHAAWSTHPAPALAQALVRIGETPDQHSLGREQRLRNLQDAFFVQPQHHSQLAGRHVLLVDDVSTTGATLHSAARALLGAGSRRVSALVFARTPAL